MKSPVLIIYLLYSKKSEKESDSSDGQTAQVAWVQLKKVKHGDKEVALTSLFVLKIFYTKLKLIC